MDRPKFPLFFSHIDLAHHYWERLLSSNDHVIDATCGNGFDTLFLAKLLFCNGKTTGNLTAIDKQTAAIEATKSYLQKELGSESAAAIDFFERCHSSFPPEIQENSIKLIVYNLGYLPKGDKSIITNTESTLLSLKAALRLVQPGGAISVTCYPGHPGGEVEESAVINFAKSLDVEVWSSYLHSRLNRVNSPSLILIQKALNPVIAP